MNLDKVPTDVFGLILKNTTSGTDCRNFYNSLPKDSQECLKTIYQQHFNKVVFRYSYINDNCVVLMEDGVERIRLNVIVAQTLLVRFRPNYNQLVVVVDNIIQFYDLETLKIVYEINTDSPFQKTCVSNIEFDLSGNYLCIHKGELRFIIYDLLRNTDESIRVSTWDVSKKSVIIFEPHKPIVWIFKYGSIIGDVETMYKWNFSKGSQFETLHTNHFLYNLPIQRSPTGIYYQVVEDGRSCLMNHKLWDTDSKSPGNTYITFLAIVSYVWSADGNVLYTNTRGFYENQGKSMIEKIDFCKNTKKIMYETYNMISPNHLYIVKDKLVFQEEVKLKQLDLNTREISSIWECPSTQFAIQ